MIPAGRRRPARIRVAHRRRPAHDRLVPLTAVDLRALLEDERLPFETVARASGERMVLVWRLVALAESRHPDVENVEAELDRVVEHVGGRRYGMLDPWRWLPDLVRRLTGNLKPLNEDLYGIPQSFFAAPPDDR